ncbi:MAG: hypothetical protein OEW18_11675, partial [Candidatus Aminicenantes bacterium]|nr:hypothetical protein [Candidatus Aminicenantes bacterium]
LTAMCLIFVMPAFAQSDGGRAPFEYSASIGLGYGYLYKGLVTLPVQWTGSSPIIELDLERATERFSHGLRFSLGRSGRISVNDRQRPGHNSFFWLPLDYSFTWYCSRNIFRFARLEWGFGATAQGMHLGETVDLQTEHQTKHLDDFFGIGLNTAFRWRSGNERWQARVRLALTGSPPLLNRSVIRSNLVPEHHGGLWWLRADLALDVERTVASRWRVGVRYERDAFVVLRTRTKEFSTADFLSGGNYFRSHLALRFGYRW